MYLTPYGLSKHKRSHEHQVSMECPYCKAKNWKTKEVGGERVDEYVGFDVTHKEQTHKGSKV